VTGIIAADGSTVAGTGFTVTHPGPGRYTVTYTTPFATQPTVLLTAVFGSINVDAGTGVLPRENAIVDLANLTSFVAATSNNGGALADHSFMFLALTVP
jgi:hypothetical protein